MSDFKGEVVGIWERAYQRDGDRSTYRDNMHMLSDWLPKKSVFSKCVRSVFAVTFVGAQHDTHGCRRLGHE